MDDQGWSELQTCLVKRYKTLIKSLVTALTNETEIDDIYEEPELKLIDNQALRKQSSNRNEQPLNLKDIFRTDGKKFYNIYATGDAGIGKTSFCKFMLSSWCKTYQDQTNDFNDFEVALKQFDFLFYISLRLAAGQFDIEEMIEAQLLKHFVPTNEVLSGLESKFLLNELFKLFAERCLIILDGLDEWTAPEKSTDPSISNGIPMRNPSLNYTVMTFTRPWKLAKLRLKDSELDRQVKITGVKDISAFGEKLISYFNKQKNTNMTYTDFGMHLDKADLIEMQKTPFLLKHLICLWFENKEFGKSKTEVYTNLLELWFQMAEKRADERHFKPPNDPTITTPEVFKKNGKCDSYKTLLMAVGKLAFETLIHREGIQLVFDSSEAHNVTEDQMSICFKVGILTKSIVPNMISERKDISFSHKTFQEYFAALYMGWHSNNPENIESRMADITLSDREEFFIFLSGMWPSLFERLIEIQLDKLCNKSDSKNSEFKDLYNSVQELTVKCCVESVNQNKGYCPKVNLRVIVLTDDDINPTFRDLMSHMHQHQLMPNGDCSILDFSKLPKLQGIVLYGINDLELHLSPVTEKLSLERIKLKPIGVVSLMESVSGMKTLRAIEMSGINCKEHDSNEKYFMNVDLSKLDMLRVIAFSDMTATNMCLSPATKDLDLKDIHFSNHSGIDSLMKSVSSMKTVRAIEMKNIYCREHFSCSNCFLNVDLSKLCELKTIKLFSISAMEISLSPAIEKLKLLEIHLIKHSGIVSLMESVSDTKTLRNIRMNNIYCGEHQRNECFLNVDLSKMDQLESIDMYKLSATELCLSPATENLRLNEIKLLKHSAIVSLMDSVSRMKTLKNLHMTSIHCKEHDSDGFCECFRNVDLSKLDKLETVEMSLISTMEVCLSPTTKSLCLFYIEMLKHSGIESLMKSVSSTKTLRSLEIISVYCREHDSYDCFLNVDLSKLDKLETVEIVDISATVVCLSPSIQKLSLIEIKLLKHSEIESLMKSVSSTKTLRSLEIISIYCREHDSNDCFLKVDLSKLDKVETVKIVNISVTHVCLNPAIEELSLTDIKMLKHSGIVSLMESVSSMRIRRSIKMNSMYCREHDSNDCFL